jgi:hypothetical protein
MGHINNIVSTGIGAAHESDRGFIEKAQKQTPNNIPDPGRMQRWALHSEVNAMLRKNPVHKIMFQFVRAGMHPYQAKIVNGGNIGGFWEAFMGGIARKKHVEFARLLQSIE